MTAEESVLVVDDEQAVRNVLHAMLSDEYVIHLAEDGEEALKLLQDNQCVAVLVDIALPGRLDGFELAEEIRKLSPEIKVILMTGLMMSAENRDRAAVTADALLMKPFDVEELKTTLAELLKP